VQALTAALDRVVLEMSEHERRALELRGREYAMAFDRVRIFDDLFHTGRQLPQKSTGRTGPIEAVA